MKVKFTADKSFFFLCLLRAVLALDRRSNHDHRRQLLLPLLLPVKPTRSAVTAREANTIC